jgi:cysteine desulfurase
MIYLDHAATTPLDERAREAMLPWLDCANPSSQHARGREARMEIDAAREKAAASLGCLPGEVIFTSSGTEACVTAVLGTARAALDSSRRRILIGAAEHHAVLHCQKQLAELGFRVELVPATRAGAMDLAELNITDEVLLVCAMHANNETGAITDVDAIGEKCREKGVMFFCDAVQSFKKLDLPDAELVAVSGHKINGPKGVGALRVRAGTKIEPLMSGGGQEREMRGGTENVAAIVGFGVACEMGHTVLTEPADVFREEVRRLIPQAVISCADVASLRTHVHLRIPGVSAEVALINLDRLGIAASSGAACSSGSVEPSHVLLAAGLSESAAVEGLRFTFGRGNTIGEAKQAATALATAVNVVLDT